MPAPGDAVKPQTRATLDVARCDDCGKENDEMVLNGLCHPDSSVIAIYRRKSGMLRLKCAACLRDVGDIAVAAGYAS